MSKQDVFTMKLEPELREAFMAAAKAADRPASQIIRELMRDYIDSQRHQDDYDAWLALKVEKARESMRAGRLINNEVVEAQFAALREAAMKIAER